ncbi:MAG: DNA polymerase III subunit gamma/tau [Muribaculaceae bacterium]|nr:DNA polymerase III subunit gamma/tau [Muribaculaceae bacterium]
MEQYIVSARKYRPSTFATVVGQQALTETLKNAIATNKLAHAYLFCGSRGVGKTSCARIFAKTINCEHPTPDGEACNECDSCRQFNENRSLNIIELDAASNNGVDDIRTLIDQVMVPPTQGRYRVFIIDEVHMLSSAAFNAFLKTLEEPPAHAIFILATTEKHKIIPTILSRCQIYDFSRITISDMVKHLGMVAEKEGATAEPAALNIIARKADGAMRDALSIFDQVLASSRGNITYASTIANLNVLDNSYYERLVDAFRKQDVSGVLLIYKEVRDKGFDSLFFINGLAQYLRDLMVASDPSTIVLLDAADEVKKAMAERARELKPDFLYRAMDLCNDADFNYRTASNKQLLIELTLIKLCQRLSPSTKRSGHVGGHLKPLPAPDADPLGLGAPEASAPKTNAAITPAGPPQRPAPAVSTAPREPVNLPPPVRHRPRTTAVQIETPAAEPQANYGPANSVGSTQTRDNAPAAAAEAQVMAARYSDAAFRDAWSRFIEAHASARILTSAMSTAKLERGADEKWDVTVDGELAAQAIREGMPEILEYLQTVLANSSVSLNLIVNGGEESPQMWTDSQVLSHWMETQPEVAEVIEKYKLRLL